MINNTELPKAEPEPVKPIVPDLPPAAPEKNEPPPEIVEAPVAEAVAEAPVVTPEAPEVKEEALLSNEDVSDLGKYIWFIILAIWGLICCSSSKDDTYKKIK